ncbi:hypothetical protein E5Q_03031 [Mixia osmundae IAM 14324]|uniref:RING-type domain-containing protein n=1 Tax=Mixia osmundae (strain CBS 9802 / IAM 14324 / JCM 22182 / KY 12970) TaxID=764103 RepID=G7E0K5_MIXOS|nr:hypothetical protein E5Q_03031 [Mixia osmundae IAM 14324]
MGQGQSSSSSVVHRSDPRSRPGEAPVDTASMTDKSAAESRQRPLSTSTDMSISSSTSSPTGDASRSDSGDSAASRSSTASFARFPMPGTLKRRRKPTRSSTDQPDASTSLLSETSPDSVSPPRPAMSDRPSWRRSARLRLKRGESLPPAPDQTPAEQDAAIPSTALPRSSQSPDVVDGLTAAVTGPDEAIVGLGRGVTPDPAIDPLLDQRLNARQMVRDILSRELGIPTLPAGSAPLSAPDLMAVDAQEPYPMYQSADPGPAAAPLPSDPSDDHQLEHETLANRRIFVEGTVTATPTMPQPSASDPSHPAEAAPDSLHLSSVNASSTPDSELPETHQGEAPTSEGAGTAPTPSAAAPAPRLSPEQQSLHDQAALIGHLISVAAAATAASLLPGNGAVTGAPVRNFASSSSVPPPMPVRGPEAAASVSMRPVSPRSSPLVVPTVPEPLTDRSAVAAALAPPMRTAGIPASAADPTTLAGSAFANYLRDAVSSAFSSEPIAASATTRPTGRPRSLSQPSLWTHRSGRTSDNADGAATPTGDQQSAPSNASPSTQRMTALARDLAERLGSILTRAPNAPAQSDPPRPGPSSNLPLPMLLSASDPRFRVRDLSQLTPGTFDYWLAELQQNVSRGIVRSFTPSVTPAAGQTTPSNGETAIGDATDAVAAEVPAPGLPAQTAPGVASTDSAPASETSAASSPPYQFFSMFRFPNRTVVEGDLVLAAPTSAAASDPEPEPVAAAPSEPLVGEDTPQNPGANASDPVTAASQVVPVLLVGVRSLEGQPQGAAGFLHNLAPPNGPGQAARAGSASTTTVAPTSPVPPQLNGILPNRGIPAGGLPAGLRAPGLPPLAGASELQHTSRHFLIWLAGGLYSDGHPILTFPSLFGQGEPRYEDLLRLAELFGPAVAQTATREQVEKANLTVIKGAEVIKARDKDQMLANTVDRCLICLDDYEEQQDVRILGCRHGFHKECVDRWLCTGKNACPACRSQAVEVDQAPAAETTAAMPSVI